ncbi:hypothetical protein NTE_02614 [Candidatus Nitrososphaera evergladensis SR1]|jgi:hypothetical protein|uniref:50S ribosomal protein L29 n=1 Tax=Candidatus Nitrososphaera evergladensis SR1 TaxID=1459636 RepID=A0A075MVG7_9ARCH|nr:hypothetical protein [Candidatus Nitrososphaera evergladensis]AIF84657.1 hypothetical protein NTE_02614 [Candidatus Nitrososphaera evergladensis SR1]
MDSKNLATLTPSDIDALLELVTQEERYVMLLILKNPKESKKREWRVKRLKYLDDLSQKLEYLKKQAL